jgi:hypothetical protein
MGIVYSKLIPNFAVEPNRNTMANYCGNFASITGDTDAIQKIFSIIELAGDDEGIFGLLLNVQCCTNEDRWEFNLTNFGCRSDIDKSEFLENATFVDNEDGTAELSTTFTTPWSPPLPFYASLSAIYNVRVEVEGEEGGNDYFFVGVAIDGSWVEENDLTYPEGVYRYQPDYFWDGYLESDIEWMVEEEYTEEKIREKYSYVTEKDLEEIINLFNSYKLETNEN